jgi:hypothetical protein
MTSDAKADESANSSRDSSTWPARERSSPPGSRSGGAEVDDPRIDAAGAQRANGTGLRLDVIHIGR